MTLFSFFPRRLRMGIPSEIRSLRWFYLAMSFYTKIKHHDKTPGMCNWSRFKCPPLRNYTQSVPYKVIYIFSRCTTSAFWSNYANRRILGCFEEGFNLSKVGHALSWRTSPSLEYVKKIKNQSTWTIYIFLLISHYQILLLIWMSFMFHTHMVFDT